MADFAKFAAWRLRATAAEQIHPDADLINAFLAQSLTSRERSRILDHLACCRDCREVVALSSAQDADANGTQRHHSVFSRRSWLILRWSALAACIVVVGAAITLRYEFQSKARQLTAGQGTEIARVEEKTLTASSEPKPAINDVSRQRSEAAISRPAPVTRKRVPVGKPYPAASPNAPLETKPVFPETDAQQLSAESASSGSNVAMDELVPGRAKDAGQESAGASGNISLGSMLAKKTASSTAVLNSTAPPPAVLVPRWTLTSDGILKRSLDSGRTWETIPLSGQSTFRALAVNGADIWVGGTNGTLCHSSDAGQHWTQVRPIANGQPLTADIIGIEFADFQHGTLSTSAQETWVTRDAGETWQKK